MGAVIHNNVEVNCRLKRWRRLAPDLGNCAVRRSLHCPQDPGEPFIKVHRVHGRVIGENNQRNAWDSLDGESLLDRTGVGAVSARLHRHRQTQNYIGCSFNIHHLLQDIGGSGFGFA